MGPSEALKYISAKLRLVFTTNIRSLRSQYKIIIKFMRTENVVNHFIQIGKKHRLVVSSLMETTTKIF